MSFKQQYGEMKAQVEAELARFFDEQMQSAQRKDKVLVEMTQVLKEFVLRGGKRVRPILVLLAYEYRRSVVGDQLTVDSDVSEVNILRLACAVELHHHYLLALDDMADRDEVRHGGPTLERYYREEVFSEWSDADHHGRTLASIAGALLTSFTFSAMNDARLLSAPRSAVLDVVTDQLFSDTVVGWQLQYFQNNEPLAEASEEIFMKGLEYVTSRYTFVGPLKIGLLASSPYVSGTTPSSHLSSAFAPEPSTQGGILETMLEEYGRHVGVAFQLQDDIMGLFGDPQTMGKAVGNDVREGKKTLLLQRAYQNSSRSDQSFLSDVCGRELKNGELARVQQIVNDTGSLAYSRQLAERHVAQAISMLDQLPVQNTYTDILRHLAQYVIARSV